MMNKIFYKLRRPVDIIYSLAIRGFFSWMSDEQYLKMIYRLALQEKLNLENPLTFNEKIQWLKLYDRKPIYTTLVDKYEAKKYVAEVIGEQYIIPTIGIYDKFEDIDFSCLPNQFVLKCTHDSGGLVICRDKTKFKIENAKKIINKCLKRNYYLIGREWPYKNVIPRIIAEEYMVDESGYELKDYKIFNFNGIPKIIEVDYDRFTNHKRNIYSASWKFIDMTIKYPNDPNHIIEKPKALEKMLEFSKKLSIDIPNLRTDFYCIDDKVYFGELTFFHESGFEIFYPKKYNYILGDWIKLPDISLK